MSVKFFSIAFFALLLNLAAYPVYIIIHGTFAEDAQWAQPGGEFFELLEKEANQRGHHLITFGWSGHNKHKDRVQGGRSLAKLILSYPPEEEKIVIGHSHGGNVIAMASQFLSQDPESCLDSQRKNMKIRFLDEDDIFPIEDYQQAMADIIRMKNHAKRKSDQSVHCFGLDKVYFLGTPIDEIRYKPDMTSIESLYNFYSKGDLVQQVFWRYKRLLSDHPRIVNFRIIIEDSGWLGWGNPTHSAMHDPMIAEWILAIPSELQQQGMGGFEAFNSDQNGKIHFSKYGQLQFKIDKKATSDREAKEAQNMEETFIKSVTQKD